jgi:hypothetical protein
LHSAGFRCGVLVTGDHTVNVPDAPTKADATVAAASLLEVVKDFPFESESHRSAWLGYLLPLVARPFIKGNVPMFAVSANVPGSGKGKLANVANIIALGRDVPVTPAPRSDSEEGRKAIFAILMAGTQSIVFDNLNGVFRCDTLDAVLTAGELSDRVLGRTQNITVRCDTVFAVTGNGLQLSTDLGRRSMYCTLSCDGDPSARTDFDHPDLEAYVTANQVALRDAALTIVRAWIVAGQLATGETIGSFGDWSRVVLGALAFAGQPSPTAARETSRADADGEAQALTAFMRMLAREFPGGATAAQLVNRFPCRPNINECVNHEAGREAMQGIGPVDYTAKSIGYALRKYSKRWAGGLQLQHRRDRTDTTVWFTHQKSE